MEEARANVGTELRGFAHNTLEYIDKEAELTFEPLALPPLTVEDPAAGTRSSSCAGSTTTTISRRCARTSASTGPC